MERGHFLLGSTLISEERVKNVTSFDLSSKTQSEQEAIGSERRSRRAEGGLMEGGGRNVGHHYTSRKRGRKRKERKTKRRDRPKYRKWKSRMEKRKEVKEALRSCSSVTEEDVLSSSAGGKQCEEPVARQPAQHSGRKRLFLSLQFPGSRLAAIPGARTTLLPPPTHWRGVRAGCSEETLSNISHLHPHTHTHSQTHRTCAHSNISGASDAAASLITH